jgi:hypothetical protein
VRYWEPVVLGVAQPTRPAWPPTWPLGPLWSAALGQLDPVQKLPYSYFYFQENFRNIANLVKCIDYYLFIKKMCIIYQNVQKNMLYILVSKSCMIKQL